MIKEYTCVICGKTFLYDHTNGRQPQVCGDECFRIRQRRNSAKSNLLNPVKKRRKKESVLVRCGKPFHQAMKECREQGISYAERQKRKTLEMLNGSNSSNTI